MQADEKQIRSLVATWIAATKSRDVEAVLDLMAEDVMFLVPGKPPMRKSEFAAAAKSPIAGKAPTFDCASEIQEVQVSGDWGFMWSKLTVVVTPPSGAEAVVRSGNTLSVFPREGGRWLLARDANLLGPADKGAA